MEVSNFDRRALQKPKSWNWRWHQYLFYMGKIDLFKYLQHVFSHTHIMIHEFLLHLSTRKSLPLYKEAQSCLQKLDAGENWDNYGPTKGFSFFGLKALHFQESTLIAA